MLLVCLVVCWWDCVVLLVGHFIVIFDCSITLGLFWLVWVLLYVGFYFVCLVVLLGLLACYFGVVVVDLVWIVGDLWGLDIVCCCVFALRCCGWCLRLICVFYCLFCDFCWFVAFVLVVCVDFCLWVDFLVVWFVEGSYAG